MQHYAGYRPISAGSRWRKLLLPHCAVVIRIVGKAAPQLASRLLAPCALQEAQYVFLKVILTSRELLLSYILVTSKLMMSVRTFVHLDWLLFVASVSLQYS